MSEQDHARITEKITKIQNLKKAGYEQAPDDHRCPTCGSHLMVHAPDDIEYNHAVYVCITCGWSSENE